MSKNYSTYLTVTVAAGGTETRSVSGTIFKCVKCSLPSPLVTVSFDDTGSANPLSAGKVFDLGRIGDSFTHLIFKNNDPVNVATVTYEVGNIVSGYVPSDAQVASTYARGNLGLAASGNYKNDNGVTQAVTIAAGLIQPGGPGNYLTLYGTDKGHQRKLIVFSIPQGNTIKVFDANNNLFLSVSAPTTAVVFAFETDATLKIQGGAGTDSVGIGELFFAAI